MFNTWLANEVCPRHPRHEKSFVPSDIEEGQPRIRRPRRKASDIARMRIANGGFAWEHQFSLAVEPALHQGAGVSLRRQ
jgi:hypothetical protein